MTVGLWALGLLPVILQPNLVALKPIRYIQVELGWDAIDNTCVFTYEVNNKPIGRFSLLREVACQLEGTEPDQVGIHVHLCSKLSDYDVDAADELLEFAFRRGRTIQFEWATNRDWHGPPEFLSVQFGTHDDDLLYSYVTRRVHLPHVSLGEETTKEMVLEVPLNPQLLELHQRDWFIDFISAPFAKDIYLELKGYPYGKMKIVDIFVGRNSLTENDRHIIASLGTYCSMDMGTMLRIHPMKPGGSQN